MNLTDLKKVIPHKMRKGPGGKELAYIDARDVMDLLDEVVGAENWQCDYKELGGKMYCGIGIRTTMNLSTDPHGDVTYGSWVWKWDMGTESEFDSEKGEASDAFKRAAVKWGVGRFLYDIKPERGGNVGKKTSVPRGNSKPSEKQAIAVGKMATYRKEIENVDPDEFIKEVMTWTSQTASDYIGNKINLEEARAR